MRRSTFTSSATHAGPANAGNGHLIAYQFDGLLGCSETSHAVFTRHGGVSAGAFASLNLSRSVGDDPDAVAENSRRALGALGYRREQAVTAWLVHGCDVAVMTRDDVGREPPKADAILTRERGLPLLMRFADCAPIVLYDSVRQAIGLAHAGWRGVAANVVEATVRAMVDAFGSDPRRMWAGVGPAIGVECYEVGPDVVERAAAACPPGTRLAQPGRNGRPHLDLAAAVMAQMQRADVGSIEASGMCTASNTHEWFSHRAERGRTGRFGLVIALNP